MSGSALWPVQQKIYEILTIDATLMSKVTGVFDFVPDNQTYPYVRIGEFTTGALDTYDRFGEEMTVTIHVFGQILGTNAYHGFARVEEIMDDINRLLARTNFDVQGWANVGCWFDFSTTILERNGTTRHGILRYRLLVQQEFS